MLCCGCGCMHPVFLYGLGWEEEEVGSHSMVVLHWQEQQMLCPAPEWLQLLQEMIPTSLLKLGGENATRAVKMFAGILKYLSEDGSQDASTSPSKSARIDLVQKLLHQVSTAEVSWVLWQSLFHTQLHDIFYVLSITTASHYLQRPALLVQKLLLLLQVSTAEVSWVLWQYRSRAQLQEKPGIKVVCHCQRRAAAAPWEQHWAAGSSRAY